LKDRIANKLLNEFGWIRCIKKKGDVYEIAFDMFNVTTEKYIRLLEYLEKHKISHRIKNDVGRLKGQEKIYEDSEIDEELKDIIAEQIPSEFYWIRKKADIYEILIDMDHISIYQYIDLIKDLDTLPISYRVIGMYRDLVARERIFCKDKATVELTEQELEFVIRCLEQMACEEGDFWTQHAQDILNRFIDKLEELEKKEDSSYDKVSRVWTSD